MIRIWWTRIIYIYNLMIRTWSCSRDLILKADVGIWDISSKTECCLVLKIALMVESEYEQVWICSLSCNHLVTLHWILSRVIISLWTILMVKFNQLDRWHRCSPTASQRWSFHCKIFYVLFLCTPSMGLWFGI